MSPSVSSVFSDDKRKRNTILIVSLIAVIVLICGLIAASRTFGWLQSKKDKYLIAIVDAEHPVDDDWSPEFTMLEEGQLICSECYSELDAMLRECKAAGGSIRLGDCYRSESFQQRVLEEMAEELTRRGMTPEQALETATKIEGAPGTSEHQLGYAADVYAEDLSEGTDQAESYTVSWLEKNSWKYGFILRQTENTDYINQTILSETGRVVVHLRYVGTEAANQINELGVSLEEYIEMFYS